MPWRANHRQARAQLGAAPVLIVVIASCGAWTPGASGEVLASWYDGPVQVPEP